MQQDKPLLGIMLMLGFCIVAPMGDATAKLLGAHVPILQLLLVRFAVQGLLLAPWLASGIELSRLTRADYRLIAARTVLHCLGIGMMFTALIYLPLADAVAIAFVMPFIMLLLGWFYLGESVGMYRLGACVVGFIGTLLVVQPSFQEVGWPALLPVGVAVNFAVFMLLTRRIARRVGPIALQAVSGGMATAGLLPLMLILPASLPGAGWVTPTADIWVLLVLIGALGTLGHLLMTWSLRYAPSATVAPMQYLEIPFATLIGWLVFQDWPNGLAAVGILITVAAGLFIVFREQATARRIAAREQQGGMAPAE